MTEERDAECEGNQRLRRGELKVTRQLVDDLHRHRGHRLEGIDLHAGGDTGGKHHDHRLADGARGGQKQSADNARKCCGKDDLLDCLGAGGTKAERTVAQGPRHLR